MGLFYQTLVSFLSIFKEVGGTEEGGMGGWCNIIEYPQPVQAALKTCFHQTSD